MQVPHDLKICQAPYESGQIGKRTAGKSGYHQDDHRTWDSPDKTEIRINYRKWLTSPKTFDIIALDIKYSNKKGKRRTPSDEKAGTDL